MAYNLYFKLNLSPLLVLVYAMMFENMFGVALLFFDDLALITHDLYFKFI